MIFARPGRREDAMRAYVRAVPICVVMLATAALCAPAGAAETLRVGKAVPFAWTFTPLDVGIETGPFAKQGLTVEPSAFGGDAKMQQALAADGIDIGIGSGPGMTFMAKGAPTKAVAAMAGIPTNMAVMVSYNSSIKSVDDLKGKRIGVTTVGSLTDWIGKRIDVVKGWGPRGIDIVAIGGMEPARAAMKTNQIDGYITSLESGFALEEAQGVARDYHGDALRRPLHHPCLLRSRGGDREAAAGGARLSAGMVQHHRFHEGQQGEDRGHHRQGAQPEPGGDRPRLRRGGRHLLGRRRVRPQGGGGAQGVVHRDGPAQGDSRRQGHVHDSVRAGEGRDVTAALRATHQFGRYGLYRQRRMRRAVDTRT